MYVAFQLLDADYIMADKPIIRLFGRTDENKPITVFFENFLPYFYVLPQDGKETAVRDFLNRNFKDSLVKIEAIEKYLPIGFSQKPVKLLKITLNNPAKTPTIREEVRREKSVKEVFEADILFRYRFMIDHGIFGMRWYGVTGEPANTSTTKTDKKLMARKIEELKIEENMKLKYMSLDIETVSTEGGLPDAEKDQIILISMYFYPAYQGKNSLVLCAKKVREPEEDVLCFFSEKEMLQHFLKTMEDFDPDVIVGYNINNFDLPYLEARLRKNNLPRTIGRCNQKPLIPRKIGNKTRNNIVGRIVVDVYELIKEAVTKFGLFRGLKRYGLGDVSKLILGEDKIDISHSEISNYWFDNGEKIKKLIDYSRKDAQLPIRILLKERMLDKFIELSKVTGVLLQDALEGGESTKIENLLLREFDNHNFVLPCKPDADEISRRNLERRTKGLKGAFVLSPEIGLHDKCVVYLDFRSMYPNIISSFNICPTTLLASDEKVEFVQTPDGTKFVSPRVREGIVPKIVRYLLDARVKIVEQMRRVKKPEKKRYLYARQYAFKTVANAIYGHLGYIRARLYILSIANAITSTGRETIMKTKNTVETRTPYKVVYADTDSVMVGLKTEDVDEAFKMGLEIAKLINEEFKHMFELKIESVFKTLLILSKKRYAGWNFELIDDKWEDSIITKGIETVRRDWCDIVSETLEEVLVAILKEKNINKATEIVRKKIEGIKTGNIDINKLVITKGVSKSLKSYKGVQPHVELVKKMRSRDIASAPGVGDRVGFVIVKGTQMISKRAEDPEYVKKHGLKVDSKYYIESQLLPPLERVFEALSVNRTDLLGAGKQLGLLDVMRKEEKEEKLFEEFLTEIDGFICVNCNNVMRRVPLSGRCNYCSGEIVFFKGDKKSRVYDPWRLSVPEETDKKP